MNIITKKEWIEIFPEAISYLEDDLDYQMKRFEILKQIYLNQLDIYKLQNLDSDSNDFAQTMADVFIGEDIRKCEKRIRDIWGYLRKDSPKGGVTDDDIESARAYPFENLIKLNRSGFALCPFHKDTDASFHLNKKNNTMHCFSCNKTYDTIQFLMETEGISFIQAVKILK